MTLRFVDDQHGSPTFTADLAAALVTLGTERRPGTFHITNSGATTWWAFVRAVLAEVGADPERVHAIGTSDLVPPRPAPRPANSVLDNMALRLSGLCPPAPVAGWSVQTGLRPHGPRGFPMTTRTNARDTRQRSRTVAVIGAGYVGLPSAATLAHFGHRVVLAERDQPASMRCEPGACPLSRPG